MLTSQPPLSIHSQEPFLVKGINVLRDLCRKLSPFHLTMMIQVNILNASILTLNYANYTTEDFIHWNRSAMVPEGTATRECGSWVYDRSTFTENVLSRVCIVCSSL